MALKFNRCHTFSFIMKTGLCYQEHLETYKQKYSVTYSLMSNDSAIVILNAFNYKDSK